MIALPQPKKAMLLAREIMADPRERAYLQSIPRHPETAAPAAPPVRRTGPRLPRKEAKIRALEIARAVCAEHHVYFEALRGKIRTREICRVRLEFYRRAQAAGISAAVIAKTVRRVRTAVTLALIRAKED